MKTMTLSLMLGTMLLSFSTNHVLAAKPESAFNRLNWVEIHTSSISTQIMFDFTEPVYFQKKLNEKNHQLLLSFPGMKLRNFNTKHVLPKFNKLKAKGIISNITIKEENKNIPNVILTLTFAEFRSIKDKNKKRKKVKNRFLIKWSKIEDPNRLILDIFSIELLKNMKKNNSIILQAHNTHHRSNKHPNATKNRNLRIILDPGHGGLDPGSIGPGGVKEKDITLHIARKTRSMLKKSGFRVLLTRNTDRKMSVLKRSEFACQLKADLFISIHANSWISPGNTASGIETLYLNSPNLLPPTRMGGFFFLNIPRSQKYIQLANDCLKNTIDSSKQLAHSIQENIFHVLQRHKYTIRNRGLKGNKWCRILLRSHVPTTIIEVGFVSNKIEAQRLANPTYQNLLAQGIYNGIRGFVNQHR